MKKLLSIVLVLAMVLGLCACQIGEEKPNLQVGYSRQCISPKTGVPLSGYGNDTTRISTNILHDVYVTCVAFQEEGETVLMISEDLLGSSATVVNSLRLQIYLATKIPQKNIMIAATHTHAAPNNNPKYNKEYYDTIYVPAVIAAAKAAVEDLSPATLHGTKVETEKMNYVRHYEMQDGTYAGANFGDLNKPIKQHLRDGDREMVLVKIDRVDKDKKDIVLMNWQCHPTFTGGSKLTDVSADYIGTCRDAFEAETGMLFAFFQGGGGDQVSSSRVEVRDPAWTVETYGQALAKIAADALPNMEKIEGEGVKTTQYKLTYNTNKYGQDKLQEALKVKEIYDQSGSVAAKAYGKTVGIVNGYREAQGIINCSKTSMLATMELDALYVAGMAFATAPWEMFSDTAIYIKDNSPFKYTVVVSCGNAKESYLPIKEAFEYGCYESFNATYGIGGAEAAAEQLVTMLKGLQ